MTSMLRIMSVWYVEIVANYEFLEHLNKNQRIEELKFNFLKDSLKVEGYWNKELEVALDPKNFHSYHNHWIDEEEKVYQNEAVPCQIPKIPLKYLMAVGKIADMFKADFKIVANIDSNDSDEEDDYNDENHP